MFDLKSRIAKSCGLALLSLLVASGGPVPAPAQNGQAGSPGERVTTLVDSLEHPWGMAVPPGRHMPVTEQPGRLRLAFDGGGFLFVSVGERGRMQNEQDLTTHAGKILRLRDGGRVPDDNPFVGRRDAFPGIYAYGVRNPQGLAVHPETGELWETEHRPRGGDELNRIRPGANYGWPVVTHGIDYSGKKIRGSFFVGGLAGRHLARVRLENGRRVAREKLLTGRGQRIRDVRVGPDGDLYVLRDAPIAPLFKIGPAR